MCVASAFAGYAGPALHGEYHADIPAAIPTTVLKPAVKIAHEPYAVAHHGAVLQKQVHYGSVPKTEIINEPYTITQQGPPVSGYSFQSEVRHDLRPPTYGHHLAAPIAHGPIPVGPAVAHAAPVAAYAAPIAHAAPVAAYGAPLAAPVAHAAYAAPIAHAAPLATAHYAGSTNHITGPAVAVAQAPPLVSGYSTETGRTELHSQVHYQPASIPTTVYKNIAVPGSVPRLVQTAEVHAQPVVHHAKTVVAAPVLTHGHGYGHGYGGYGHGLGHY